MKQKRVFLFQSVLVGLVLLFAACQRPASPATQQVSPAAAAEPSGSDTAALSEVTIADTLHLNRQKSLNVSLLLAGTFHGDEVPDDAASLPWMGLFRGKRGYYLAQTPISTTHVEDAIMDEAGEKTGWLVTTPSPDSCLLLIAPLDFLKPHPVKAHFLHTQTVYPGDEHTFTYLGKGYRIFATGRKRQFAGWAEVSDYKLYLSMTVNGETKTSLLADIEGFDDSMVEILFAGDIDGDGLLDLLIDTASHYNSFEPTLFLSQPAATGEAVQEMGTHSSVGC